MNKELLENLLNTFGAQFGEIAWYDLEYDDPRVSEMVRHQTHEIKEAIKENFSDVEFKDLRVLEVGAYRHHNMHIINHDFILKGSHNRH